MACEDLKKIQGQLMALIIKKGEIPEIEFQQQIRQIEKQYITIIASGGTQTREKNENITKIYQLFLN